MVERFIPTKMIINKAGNFIPIWELDYVKDDYYGDGFKEKDNNEVYRTLSDCYYDSKKKKIVTGVIIDVYEEPKYKVGEKVVYTERYFGTQKCAEVCSIKEITYLDFKPTVKKISKEDIEYNRYNIKDIESLKKGDLVEIRDWKAVYILNDDTQIEYNYQIIKLKEDELSNN